MVGEAGAVLGEERERQRRVEERGQRRRRREPVAQPVAERTRERARDRDREAALAAREDRARDDPRERVAQHPLRREPADLPRRGQRGRVLDQALLEERRAGLEADPHARAVHLREQRVGQVEQQVHAEQRVHRILRRRRRRRRGLVRGEACFDGVRGERVGPEQARDVLGGERAEPPQVARERRARAVEETPQEEAQAHVAVPGGAARREPASQRARTTRARPASRAPT